MASNLGIGGGSILSLKSALRRLLLASPGDMGSSVGWWVMSPVSGTRFGEFMMPSLNGLSKNRSSMSS